MNKLYKYNGDELSVTDNTLLLPNVPADSKSTGDALGLSVFNGKTASFFGDSLTEVNFQYTKGYHQWVKEIIGLASYNNYGVSGYDYPRMLEKINSVSDNPDIVFLMGGINDYNAPFGEWGDKTNDTIYGRLYLLCQAVKQKYSSKIIIFITPPYQTKYPHVDGITAFDYREAIIKTCAFYAIAVYDNCVLSGIHDENLNIYTNDNCHWNDKAHEMVGKNLAEWILTHFRYIYH